MKQKTAFEEIITKNFPKLMINQKTKRNKKQNKKTPHTSKKLRDDQAE